MKAWLSLLASAACVMISTHAHANDYPTLDRVLFVEECMHEERDRSRVEMVYKCSCVFDEIATQIPYASFVHLETASNALGIAGERGSSVRTEETREQARNFRRVLSAAKKSCLITH